MLSTRTETILKNIVGQYIAKARPVASQNLINDYELKVSSATIRNEMALLEKEGFIKRGHCSSGAVPSDKGYRHYVGTLGETKLPLTEQRMIRHLFHQVEKDLEEWLKLTARLIAQLAQNMAIATTPKSKHCRFKSLELLPMQEVSALLVLILEGAKVKQQLVTMEQPISQGELIRITNHLNTTYSGLGLADIAAKEDPLSPAETRITETVTGIMKAEDEREGEDLYFTGLHFMLNQPEFAQNQRALPLMELVDHDALSKIIAPRGLKGYEVRVTIGEENKTQAVKDYSIVISRYGLPSEAGGVIGIIGPTRMPYARTISSVSYISSLLSELVKELYDEDRPDKSKGE